MCDTQILPLPEFKALCKRLLLGHGVPARAADVVADALLWCDLHGIQSHGIAMLTTYLERIRRGGLRADAEPRVVHRDRAVAVVDGEGGFGQLACELATHLACDLARENGVGAVSVRNTSHAGALGYYTSLGASRGFITFMVHNSNPAMAPHGGMKAAIGTNPISFGFPGDLPIIVDLATSATAKGKLYQLAREDAPIPEGFALNAYGQPARTAAEAVQGVLLPLGGPKGYALAVAVEVLTGVLSGGRVTVEIPSLHRHPDRPQGVSALITAIDPDAFLDRSVYVRGIERLRASLKATPLAPGADEITLPGEREARLASVRRRDGIPVPTAVLTELAQYQPTGR